MFVHWEPTPGLPAILSHEIPPLFSTSLFFTLCALSSVSDTYSSLVQAFKRETRFQINKLRGFTSITYTRFAIDTPEKFV